MNKQGCKILTNRINYVQANSFLNHSGKQVAQCQAETGS
jgi:hypothetical protein